MKIQYGTKYEQTKNLDIKEIAKLVRQDLKENFKGYKFSVKIRRYSGGRSLDVVIISIPTEGYTSYEAYNTLRQQIQKIVDAYNFDGSDAMTDYFHVNFYSHVEFSQELRNAEWKALRGIGWEVG